MLLIPPDYEFSVQQAWELEPPPIKKLCLQEATSTGFLVLENDIEVEYDPEDFLAKAQSSRAWFRQIMLADSFSLPVLERAVKILLSKRSATGQPHAMLIRALNIPHTHRVAKLLEDNFSTLKGRVLVIHSQHDQYDLAGRASELLERFYSGDYIIAVHCGLVGVGFDHKWISVSCCLCVLKSMSPAEQEWGRALRQVPGPPPGQFPELNHPNWGVVVTHSALGLREMFEKFQQGVSSDVVKDAPVEQQLRPTVADAYEAGETVLRLSDTKNVKPGDVLELRVPVAVNEANSPKFNLLEELSNTGSLMESTADADAFPNTRMNGSNAEAPSSMSHRGEDAQQLTLLTWQQEVDAIGAKLAEIKSVRTYQVHVEAVLDSTSVQITPAWSDFPAGVEVAKSRAARVIPDADFVQHVGLDWQVMIGQELISYRDYQKRVVLQSKGMSLDQEGEIVVNGVRLKDTMPPAVFDLLVNLYLAPGNLNVNSMTKCQRTYSFKVK